IQVACPGCNTRANLPDTLAGKTVRCNRCSQVFRVPGVAPPGAARPPARGPAAPEGQPARGYGPPRAAFWLGALVGLAVAGVAAVAVVAWGLRDREEPSADAGAPAGEPAANPPPAQPGTPGAGEAPAAGTAAAGGVAVPEDRWAELPLPGEVGDLCVGGSGRYLILHLPAKKQFAVFDAYEARVVKELPAPEGGVKFAAGASKLVAVSALDHTAERWHLGTFEKEATVQLPVSGEVKAVCMGHASEGPLLVHAGGSGGFPVRLFDLATLRPLPSDPRLPSTLAAFESPHYRASADGRAFACWSTGSGSRNSAVFWLEGGRVARSYSTPRPQGGHVEPDSRNRLLLAADGILSGKLRNISWGTDPFFAVPARQGEFFLRCVTPRAMTPTPLGVAEQICVHSAYDEKPLALFPVGGLGLADERYAATDFTADKRFHLIPGASLIALVPDANDRLLLRRFDAAAAAAREGLPRAAAAGAAMPPALAGSVYRHRIPLAPGAGDFRFALK
ncbi:MAG TPA: hypothetical protein VIL46_09695, partial [Gemmataceae bacterium]